MKFAVLNPGGRDPEQQFPDGAGTPDKSVHPPVNFHGYAACLRGGFYKRDAAIPKDVDAVLVLLRRDLKEVRQSLVDLRRAGKRTLISFKESGMAQVAALLSDAGRFKLFREICQRADGAVAAVEDLVPIYRAAGARRVEFIPTPYPIEDERWCFASDHEFRKGIFIGTREFDVPSRNHLAALLTVLPLAEPMQEPVTVMHTGGWGARRLLGELPYSEGLLRIIPGPLPYPEYLALMARHKIVFQLDASCVPGQVAGDALLCRIPCVGGNGTTERLAFPDLSGDGRTPEQLFDLAARLLEHQHDCFDVVERAVEFAKTRLSYSAVASMLTRFVEEITPSRT